MAGAVLIGGRSRRMGRHKAAMDLGRGPLASVLADQLVIAGCAPVWLVGADRGVDAGVARLDDRWPGQGPVGGIATALRAAAALGCDGVLVIACDLPDLDPGVLLELIGVFDRHDGQAPDVVVARSPRGLEPMIALWSVACTDTLAAAAEDATSVLAVLDRLETSEHTVESTVVRNVNTPADLWSHERAAASRDEGSAEVTYPSRSRRDNPAR